MPSSYKRLGDFIHKVENRNRDSKVSKLVGLSMTKEFRVSTSNIVGTDMSVYKVVNKWQFSCDFMSVIRVHKFPVVLKTDDESVLVSPAYTVFEVNSENELNPEYLMMWFRRSEFDRYADFKCDSAIRGGFDWDALCDCLLPIPSIEKQCEMVREYNTVQNCIDLNNQLITKLEETAQAIYKQWFVDFEFPDENGKSYKSNGGKMIWCEELEKEIPEGWEYISFLNICEIGSSKRIYEYEYCETGIPFYRGKEITLKKNGLPIREPYFISNDRYNELVKKYGKPSEGDILLTAVGTIGSSYMVSNEDFYFKDGNIIWLKNFNNQFLNYFIYDFMQTDAFNELIDEITIGSTQSAITITTLNEQKIIIPTLIVLKNYYDISKLLNQNRFFKINENQILEELKDLLLAKMTRVNLVNIK
jgi:type I restriction enzyme S subunit